MKIPNPDSEEYLKELHGNWERPESYPGPDASIHQWGWEFIRRNITYQRAHFNWAFEHRKLINDAKNEDDWHAVSTHQHCFSGLDYYESDILRHICVKENLNPLNSFYPKVRVRDVIESHSFSKVNSNLIYPPYYLRSDDYRKNINEESIFISLDFGYFTQANFEDINKKIEKFIKTLDRKPKIGRKHNENWAYCLRAFDASKLKQKQNRENLLKITASNIPVDIHFSGTPDSKKSELSVDPNKARRRFKKFVRIAEELINDPLQVRWRKPSV